VRCAGQSSEGDPDHGQASVGRLGGPLKSKIEEKAFAAAGNDGNSRSSYPAGYASVVSVAAVDANRVKADFSQYNRDVELAAPGVDVLSTVPFRSTATLSAQGGATWSGSPIEGAATSAGVSGRLVDGGLCTSVGTWSGAVVLGQRGTNSFAEMVAAVKSGGGVAAVIYNNTAGGFLGTLGDGVTSTLPAISLSDTDGAAAVASAGSTGTVVNVQEKPASGYEAWSGTSMATPHVSGIAALIWSCKPVASAKQVRDVLNGAALNLSPAGRDTSYGYGLVQAKAALDRLPGASLCS
jgi:subtilisin family serine protease